MIGADATRLQGHLDGHQHIVEPVQGDGGEHLGHDAITACMAQQVGLQLLQGWGHGLERSAIAQGTGLAFEQGDVVAPVVDGLLTLEAAHQRHRLRLPLRSRADDHQAIRIGPDADTGMGPLAGHAVAVALEVDQRGGADPGHQLDVAVKRPWVGHELQVLLLPDIGQRQFGPLGVAQLVPGVQAGLVQPGVERGQIGPASFGRLAPDAAAAILHVLLDDALLPAGGPIAKLRLEQVVACHRLKAQVDLALLAAADLIDGGLHVVVDPPARHATEGSKCPGMGVKEHLVGLAEVGGEHEHPAGRQLGVGDLQPLAQAADKDVLTAPVELEGFAQFETHGHKARSVGAAGLLFLPAFGELVHGTAAAGVAHGLQRPKHGLDASTLAFVAVAVGLEPGAQLILVGVQHAGRLGALGIAWLGHLVLVQPLAGCVAGDAQPSAGFAHAQVVPQDHAAQLAQCAHVDHS